VGGTSLYFRRQIYVCFWFERAGLRAAIQALGADNLMYESDFPHPTCLYPAPLSYPLEGLAGIDHEVLRNLTRPGRRKSNTRCAHTTNRRDCDLGRK
jgi:uncharacterized protein